MHKQTCVDLELWNVAEVAWPIEGKGEALRQTKLKKSPSIWEKRKVVPYLTTYKNKYLQIDLTVKEKSLKTFNFKF